MYVDTANAGRVKIFLREDKSIEEFMEWSRDRPIARLFADYTWRRLWYVTKGEVRGMLHRINYSRSKYYATHGSAGEKKSAASANAFKILNDSRPWITLYDADVFTRGFDAALEWAKSESFPGKCSDCFHWRHQNNDVGLCVKSKPYFLPAPPIAPAIWTQKDFFCASYSSSGWERGVLEDEKLCSTDGQVSG